MQNKKYIQKAIELFKNESVPYFNNEELKFDPERFYSSGHCAEFSFSLSKFAFEKDLKPTIIIMYSDELDEEDGNVISTTFSHCIVEIDDETFDISGSDARSTWFLKHDYMYQYSNSIRKWNFIRIPFDDEYDVFNKIKHHCQEHNVEFGNFMISENDFIFYSIGGKEELNNLLQKQKIKIKV